MITLRRSSDRTVSWTPTATSLAASTTPNRPGSRPSRACASSRSTTPVTTSLPRPCHPRQGGAGGARQASPRRPVARLLQAGAPREVPRPARDFLEGNETGEKVKQSMDAGAAKELLSMIDTIDEMWKTTGGPEKTRVNGRPPDPPSRARPRLIWPLVAIPSRVWRGGGWTWSRSAAARCSRRCVHGDRLLVARLGRAARCRPRLGSA